MKQKYSLIDPYYGPYDSAQQALSFLSEIGEKFCATITN